MTGQMLSLLQEEKLASPDATDDQCVQAIAARALDEVGVDSLPVNLDYVASFLDISEIVVDASLDVAGCLVRTGGRSIIRVRGSDSHGRQRFTIGNECGHTFLPGFYLKTQYRCATPEFRPTVKLINRDEVLCDVAASALVLPPTLIRPIIRSEGFSLTTASLLAEAADSSLIAACRSLVDNWHQPAAVLRLELRNKPTEPTNVATERLRLVSWHHNGSGWPHFLRHKSTEAPSLLQALQGAHVHHHTTLTSLLTQPVQVDLHAQPYGYIGDDGRQHDGVVAVIRPATSMPTR